MQHVVILGEQDTSGIYILRMRARQAMLVQFGRYRRGLRVNVAAGELLYVGSALAPKGSMAPARRLLRHATRRSPRPPHAIRPHLAAELVASGLATEGILAPKNKKLFWNIDYLLDELHTQLTQVFLMRTAQRLEDTVAEMIACDPVSAIVAPGLGAHDRPGSTHLFRITAGPHWWRALPDRVVELATQDHK